MQRWGQRCLWRGLSSSQRGRNLCGAIEKEGKGEAPWKKGEHLWSCKESLTKARRWDNDDDGDVGDGDVGDGDDDDDVDGGSHGGNGKDDGEDENDIEDEDIGNSSS